MATADSMLFSWRDVERLPDLERLALALEHLPDGELVSALEARRGKGRDDYPVRAMWRALAAGVVFGHESSASLLRELRRNPALLEMCGFDPLGWQRAPARTLERDARGRAVVVEFPGPRRDGIPTEAAFSRFLSSVSRLEEETGAVSAMAASLRRSLMEELPGFGRHLGYDGKALPSHSTGRKGAESGKTSDPDADWGNHETSGGGRAFGQGVDEGEALVRVRVPPDRGRGARGAGVVRRDAGVGVGAQGSGGGRGGAVRGGAGAGGAVRRCA